MGCSGNSAECCGSDTNAIVYHKPTPSNPSTSKSVTVYTTTDSHGSVYTTSSTSIIVTTPPGSSSVTIYTTTDSSGSIYTTSSTKAPPASSSISSSVVVYTTTSGSSTYVTSSTSVTTYGPSVSTGVTTLTNTITSTDKYGSTITSTATSKGTTTQTLSSSVPSPLCPFQNGKSYSDTNGVVYTVYCGVDFPGNDLPAVHVDNVYDCMDACDDYVPSQSVHGGAVCVAACYGEGNVGGNCYLKYAITDVNTNAGGIIALRKNSYIPTQPPNYLPSTTNTYPKTDTTAPTFTPPPNGGGGGGGQTTPSTSPTSSSLSIISSSSSTSTTVNPTLAPSPCPTGDGQPYICKQGSVFDIHCGQNYPGNDLPAVHTDTFSECIEACANYVPSASVVGGARCVAASWGFGNTGGNCYLKYQVTTIVYGVPGFSSCNRHDYALPVTSSTTQQQTTTYSGGGGATTSSTPGSNGGGGGVTTSSTSTSSSISNPPSNGGGGSTSSSSTSSTINTGPTPIPTLTRTPVCPNDNNTRYVDSLGVLYDTRCGFQIDGDNAQPAHADTFPKCLEFCDLLGGCAAVTYLDGAPSTQANCYPYSVFRAITRNGPDGVFSGIPVGGPTPINAQYNSGDVCVGSNNGTYTDVFGGQYLTGCNQNILGGPGGTDLKATALRTLKACLTYCTHYNTCVSVDFTGFPVQGNAGNCYPKFAPVGQVVPSIGTSFAVTYQP